MGAEEQILLNKILAALQTGISADITDRATRLLGKVYGDQGVLTQRATSLDLQVQLRNAGTEYQALTIGDLTPSSAGSIFNTALPVAEADWFGTAISITANGTIRVAVQVSVAGILRARITRAAATISANLNNNSALTPSALMAFDIPVKSGDTLNLRYSVTTGNIDYCELQFLRGE